MCMFIEILLFILGLVLLVKGGGWFVDGAVGVAHRFHMPELLIGATVVSVGTTIPEVMVSSAAALTEGASDMAYGNALGSIICNTALIAAITITFAPAAIEKKALRTPIIFFFIAAAFYSTVAYATGYFSRSTGIILLLLFVIYMAVTLLQAKKTKAPAQAEASCSEPQKEAPVFINIIKLVIGAAVIAIGADLLVDNGTLIAEDLGVPESVIALTFVALGTSLPELVTAISSLMKGHTDLSLGNIIGANLFNLVLVSALACTLAPFNIPQEKTLLGMNASLLVDIPVMIFVSLLMCVPALIKGRLYRAQGVILLITYVAYTIFQLFC